MRVYELATAAAFAVLAAVAMFDTRRGAMIGATRDPGGIGAGFYPFWSAAIVGIAALLLIWRMLARPPSAENQSATTGPEGTVGLTTDHTPSGRTAMRMLSWRSVTSRAFWARSDSAPAVLTLVLPMIVATISMLWLGLYVTTALYMGFFARIIGHYRWAWVIVIAVLFPLALYLSFEQGFHMNLPKSVLYAEGLPI